MSVVKARSLDSAEEFLESTRSLRSAEPVLTNLLGSIATGVVNGRTYDKCHWWVVESDGAIKAAAMRTAPHQVILSPMDENALAALVPLIEEEDPDFPGISGTREVLEKAAKLFNTTFVEKMSMLIYVLHQLKKPSMEGRSRASSESDVDLLLSWHDAFALEADVVSGADRDRLSNAIRTGWFTVWERDSEVVAFAGNAQTVETEGHRIGRVGPVYTPPEYRRRGYGAAVTSAVSERLQKDGCDVIMLYTDAANPTSNNIYQKIGYELVSEWADLKRES